MKHEAACYVSVCDTGRKVKAHVLCLHGVLKMIISDRGSQFVPRFWEQLHMFLGTRLIHSSAYHPQTDDQTE
jgi:hypothetical protein